MRDSCKWITLELLLLGTAAPSQMQSCLWMGTHQSLTPALPRSAWMTPGKSLSLWDPTCELGDGNSKVAAS